LNGATAPVHDMIPPLQNRLPSETHEFLSRCRIGRQAGWKITEIDFPACTTLNLAGTMGDLFFKYDPPLITAQPDVSILPLQLNNTSISRNEDPNQYMLVMASDGLWDHMAHQDPQVQHSMVANYVDATMGFADVDQFGFVLHPNPSSSSPSSNTAASSPSTTNMDDTSNVLDPVQKRLQKLGILAHGLCDREMTTCQSQLFTRGYLRYDDVTSFVVVIEGTPQQATREDGQSQ
jgi:hypothetical protein